jgi:hypothetical protein
MFIKLNSGDMLNLFWLDNFYIDKHDDTRIIYVYVNGAKKIETFETNTQASSRYTEIEQKIYG